MLIASDLSCTVSVTLAGGDWAGASPSFDANMALEKEVETYKKKLPGFVCRFTLNTESRWK